MKRAFDSNNIFKIIHLKMSTGVPPWEFRVRSCLKDVLVQALRQADVEPSEQSKGQNKKLLIAVTIK